MALGYELRITDVLVLVVVLVLVGLVFLRVKREEERSGASKYEWGVWRISATHLAATATAAPAGLGAEQLGELDGRGLQFHRSDERDALLVRARDEHR